MGDRFLLWLGAGAVTAGVTMGMLAGAGMAAAETGSDADPGTTSSQSDNPAGHDTDAGAQNQKQSQPQTSPTGNVDKDVNKNDDMNDDAVGTGNDTSDTDPAGTTVTRPGNPADRPVIRRATELVNSVVAALTQKPTRTVQVDTQADRTAPAEKVADHKTDQVEAVGDLAAQPTLEAAVPQTSAGEQAAVSPQQPRIPRLVDPALFSTPALSPFPTAAETITAAPFTTTPFSTTASQAALPTPMLARAPVAESAAQVRVPPILSLVGTVVFGLISLAESVIEGPPMVPPGSNVTVKRSTLTIGDQEVPADWYFPDGDTPPQGVIYLQHGFLARGVFYDYTAAALAESTNSIVVAPTITSNVFAVDGMWLGGDPMHRAVADLFLDGNDALLVSAQAAGYGEDELPQRVVLVGHSLGGGLVADVAGYMAEDEAAGLSSYQLVGVLMLDGVDFGDPQVALRKIPDSIPVYNLSATPYAWNLFGAMDYALGQVRGDQFHGAQLLGGLHSDSMLGGNPLIQFGAYLVTGFSLPRNVEASQILQAGWINDMYAGTRTPGLYGEPGSVLLIPTDKGTARALVAPKPGVITSVLREVTAAVIGLSTKIVFATCAVPEADSSAPQTGVGQEIPTPNTALSLDERGRTVQSVGQHVCTG